MAKSGARLWHGWGCGSLASSGGATRTACILTWAWGDTAWPQLCSFLFQVTFISGKLSSIFCHGWGSAMARARHYFIPSILPFKCIGLPGKQNRGSRRGQVFWGLQILVHLFMWGWLHCALGNLKNFPSCLGLTWLILTSWRNQMHTTICRMLLTLQSNTLVSLSSWTLRVRIPCSFSTSRLFSPTPSCGRAQLCDSFLC